jgi:hypothetical protein
VAPSPPNLSFSFLDIMGLIKDSPEHLKEVLDEVMTEYGVLAPLATHLISVREFPAALVLSKEEGSGGRTPVLVLDDPATAHRHALA